jgi:hypothetical protein
MDVESLVSAGANSAAEQLLKRALRSDAWVPFGQCPAGEMCPFCTSARSLQSADTQINLLNLLNLSDNPIRRTP